LIILEYEFDPRRVVDRFEQPWVVEPVDPGKRGELDVFQILDGSR
jgi:hypothetical protein